MLRTDWIVEVAMADDGRERLYASIDCKWASSRSVVVDVMNVLLVSCSSRERTFGAPSGPGV